MSTKITFTSVSQADLPTKITGGEGLSSSGTILDQLSFKVTVKGDLVLGKLKLAGNQEVVSALRVLGELTGFTRQIDLSMDSEDKVEEFTRLFRERSGRAGTASAGEEKSRA